MSSAYPPLLILVLNPLGGLRAQEHNKTMSEAEPNKRFQAFAEADTTSVVVRSLLEKANERNMAPLEYITEAGPEIREIFDRMMAVEARFQAVQ